MPAPRVNWDVLLVIMEFLDRRSLLSTMRTCHTLYTAGVPMLLNGPIQFRRHLNVRSFCKFMLRDFPDRLRHLRELEFPERFWLRKKDTVWQLATIIRHAPSLERVSIANAEQFFKIDPELRRAFAGTRSLREFLLDRVGDEALSVLTRMRSPLHTLDLFADAIAVERIPDPIIAFTKFSATLQRLRVRWVQFESTAVKYPALQTLSIEDDNYVPVALLIQVFPNLQKLCISTNVGVELDETEMLELHVENRRSQTRACSWRGLDYLEGDVTLLYCLAPTCKVRCLSAWPSFSDIGKLVQVCRDTRPEAIKIYFHMDKVSVNALEPIFRSTEVKYLSVTIDSYAINGVRDVEKYLMELRELVNSLPLITLYFRFTCSDDEPPTSNGTYQPPNPIEQYLSELDIPACVQDSAEAIKSLRYVFADMAGRPMSYWHILRDESGEVCKEQLSNEVGEQIVQATFDFQEGADSDSD